MAFPEDHAQHSISHDGEEDGDRFVWRLPIYQPPTRQPLLSPNRAKNLFYALTDRMPSGQHTQKTPDMPAFFL